MTTFNGEEFIYGYPKEELMLFALACREAGITNEKLHEINFNIEWAVDAVRKEVETVVRKNLDDIVNRIAEQTEPKPICESCSKNPCKKKEMINAIGHWVSECTEFDRKNEPQYDIDKGTIKCDNCSENGSYKCSKCDGEMYFKRLEVEDEPQTSGTPYKIETSSVCKTKPQTVAHISGDIYHKVKTEL